MTFRTKIIIGYFVTLILLGSACTPKKEQKVSNVPVIGFTVQRTLPHDTKSFTQGLAIHEGQLYESTGQQDSWIGVVDVKTGVADRKVVLDKKYFGEGVVILNDKVYQLTWQNKVGFVYSVITFEKLREFTVAGEGWGLTTDGSQLIMSDGTEKLTFLDTATLNVTRSITVTQDGNPVVALNELEYADGFVYANIWTTNVIVRIDPKSGEVKGIMDLSALAQQAQVTNPQAEVLNGIAWHPKTRTMLVTGKFWPFIFILKLKD